MTFSFFSFLQSIFRPMSTSTTSKFDNTQHNSSPPSVFLPLTALGLDISEYMRLLRDKAVLTPEGRVELSKHMVTKLEHMKEKKGVEHEYVIATVKYNDTEVRLSIERTKGTELPKDYQRKESPTIVSNRKILTVSSLPSSSQDSLCRPTSARDMVKYIGHQTSLQPSHVLNTFHPRPNALSLLQLALIIETVHDVEERYAPFRAQCYWFAMLVMGTAMVRGGQVQSSEGGKIVPKELPPAASKSNLSHIPILPPPPAVKGEAAVEGRIGKHSWVPVVAVEVKDIQNVAAQAERRYEDELENLESTWASIASTVAQGVQEDAAKRIKELEEELRQLRSQPQAESS